MVMEPVVLMAGLEAQESDGEAMGTFTSRSLRRLTRCPRSFGCETAVVRVSCSATGGTAVTIGPMVILCGRVAADGAIDLAVDTAAYFALALVHCSDFEATTDCSAVIKACPLSAVVRCCAAAAVDAAPGYDEGFGTPGTVDGRRLCVGVPSGVTTGDAFGVSRGLAFGVSLGDAFGVSLGLAFGVSGGDGFAFVPRLGARFGAGRLFFTST